VANPAIGGSAFPRSKSGIFDLILNPAVSGKHFETASIVNKFPSAAEYSRKKYFFSKLFSKP
jgi:hypothetical protein